MNAFDIEALSGNAPTWIAVDADLARSAELVVKSKCFENHLVVDERVCAAFCRELEERGAALLRPSEVERLNVALFENGDLSPALLGRSAAAIATAAGIERPYLIRLLVAPLPLAALDGPLGREKLVPVLSLFVAHGETRRRGPTNRRPFGPFVDSTGHFR